METPPPHGKLPISYQIAAVVQETSEFNQIFIHSSLDDADLSAAEFRVYAHLARRAGGDTAYPGIDSMAKICHLAIRTVIDAVRELEKRSMLQVIRINGRCSIYKLTKPSVWRAKDRCISDNAPESAPDAHRCISDNGTVANEITVPLQCGQRKYIQRSISKEVRESGEADAPPRSSRFCKPTPDEQKAHAIKLGMPLRESDSWRDYYESNGWRVGKNPMKCWKSSMSMWYRKSDSFSVVNRYDRPRENAI